ncbi:MAG: hypothetical protein KKC46_13700 [Proteobacteria bacterium]|nr:hypothetical protein [Pseudomonadota bacterium]
MVRGKKNQLGKMMSESNERMEKAKKIEDVKGLELQQKEFELQINLLNLIIQYILLPDFLKESN